MGRKRAIGQEGITPLKDSIQVDFVWRGKRLRPTLKLRPSSANLKYASRVREEIRVKIKSGTFSHTDFSDYFPDYKFTGKIDVAGASNEAVASAQRTFREWFQVWAERLKRNAEHSTRTIYSRHVNAYWIPEFGNDHPRNITEDRILKHLSKLASNRVDVRTGYP